MPAEILFAGGRMESVLAVAGSPVSVTTGGRFDAAWSDSAITLPDPFAIQVPLFTAAANILSATTVVVGETLFFHCEMFNGQNSQGIDIGVIEFRDSAGFPWLSLRSFGSSDSYRIAWNSGTGASPVWTSLGANITITFGVISTIDFSVTLGSPHTANFYVNTSLFRTGTFTQALFTNVAGVRLAGTKSSASNNNHFYSQILCARDLSTIGAKVRTSRASGAGNSNDWSGTFANINEPINSDATVQSAVSAGLKSTHAMSDITVTAGFEIRSIFHWLRAKNDGSAPNNIKSVLRHGGADYATGNLSGLTVGYSPIGARYDTDPLLSNWTQSSWNAIEAGYESAT